METNESNNKENQGELKQQGKRFKRVKAGPRELRALLKEVNGTKRKFQLRDKVMEEVEVPDHIDKKYKWGATVEIYNELHKGEGISPHWSPKDQ